MLDIQDLRAVAERDAINVTAQIKLIALANTAKVAAKATNNFANALIMATAKPVVAIET